MDLALLFGMAGSNNDINVLDRSPVFGRLAEGNAPQISFVLNGHTYTKGYYLADGIYPEWSTFVKTIRLPKDEAEAAFAKAQEACRKDVERAFGVLQARWAIVRHPALTWSRKRLNEVMTCCVIMHNMIVEDERGDPNIFDLDWEGRGDLVEPTTGLSTFEEFLHMHHEIHDGATHKTLQADLVKHMWAHHGNQPLPTAPEAPPI